jgi:hypothetical protein
MCNRIAVLLVSAAAAVYSAPDAPLSVHLRSTLPSPQPVGTPIGFAPRIENPGKGMLVARYSVSVNGGRFRIVRDFSQQADFAWAPELVEQTATIRVTVRNNETKATAQDELPFRIVSRLKGPVPVVTPTSNPLIALFTAPPCPEGSQFRVAFAAEGEESINRTPAQPCRGSGSSNVYVAGMRAETAYRLYDEVMADGGVKAGAALPFHTGILDGHFTPVSIAVPRTDGSPVSHPVLIHSAVSRSGNIRPLATDLEGRVIWYLRSEGIVTRVIPGGRFLVLADGANSVNEARKEQVLSELDLAGNIIRETNIDAVAEQLASRGIHSDCRKGGKECVSGFHHEAIRLPNGHTLAIAGIERMIPPGSQKAVDVLGDLVIDLDEDFQVAGIWNAFDHLDLKRKSLSGEKCKTGGGGCPAILLADEADSPLHSNSLNYIPSSGDLLISIPEQDWVVKVDWKDGKGSGKIVWRLGKDGDFKLESAAANSWFSYAHDVGYEPAGSDILTIMDNNQRDPKAGSRAQAWKINEEKRVATLLYNADLGVHVNCCGSMQVLKGGGYSTVAGWVPTQYGRTVETDKDGKVVFAMDVEDVIVYRSFRVDDMYSAPVK